MGQLITFADDDEQFEITEIENRLAARPGAFASKADKDRYKMIQGLGARAEYAALQEKSAFAIAVLKDNLGHKRKQIGLWFEEQILVAQERLESLKMAKERRAAMEVMDELARVAEFADMQFERLANIKNERIRKKLEAGIEETLDKFEQLLRRVQG